MSRNVKVQLEQAVDSALQRGNHHGWALVMMVFLPLQGKGWSRSFPAGGISTRCRDLAAAGCNARSCYCRGARLPALLGRYSPQSWCILNGPACLFSSSPQGWQLVPFAHFMSRIVEPLSGNRLRYECGALNSLAVWHADGRDFGYQEAPSVSEVAVWFIYLIPALVAFALPPRAGATASRPRNKYDANSCLVTTYFKGIVSS